MSAPVSPTRCSLITGGAGFIGSHLAAHLQSQGESVVVIDNFSTGRWSNLEHLDQSRLTVLGGSVTDRLFELRGNRFQAVYHLAAAVGVRLVIERPIDTIETNVNETSAVLRFAVKDQIPTLIASTSEVYGKSTKTPFSEDDDVMYGPTIFSRWSYACSKAIDEYLALAYFKEYGLPVVIARFFNTVGPRQVGDYGMVLPRFVAAAMTGAPLEVHGDGRQSRCFCDVRDVVPALPRLLTSRTCRGRVFNIGSDRSLTILELAELVKTTLGSDSPIVMTPYEEAFSTGFDDLRRRQPDLTRIRSEIGFSADIPLERTILDLSLELQRHQEARSGPQ